jgi:hypothetical protein
MSKRIFSKWMLASVYYEAETGSCSCRFPRSRDTGRADLDKANACVMIRLKVNEEMVRIAEAWWGREVAEARRGCGASSLARCGSDHVLTRH